MARNNPRKPGKNAPCPCGSGEKYKRCCLPKEAAVPSSSSPDGDDDAVAWGRFADALRDSVDLPEALDWTYFDFGVDLFDPVVSDLTDLAAASKGNIPEASLLFRESQGIIRHVNADVRARLCEELETRSETLKEERISTLARAAIIALEDMKIDAPLIGMIQPLYHRYIIGRVLALQMLYDQEARDRNPALLALSEKVADTLELADILTLAERLRPLGPGALPYLEFALHPAAWNEALAPLIGILADHPGLRAARLLETLLQGSMSPGFDRLIFEALARMPEQAWPLLLYRVRDPEEEAWNRLASYDLLIRARQGEVFRPLMREFAEGVVWMEPVSDVDLPELARKLAALGDRRAVGTVIKMIHRKEIRRPAGIEALREGWQANGWWKEVDEALAGLRRGTLILVKKGEEMNDLVRKQFSEGTFSAIEGAQFHLNILQEEWNHAFHEDLDWLRPVDLHEPGPQEIALMRAYVSFAQARLASDGKAQGSKRSGEKAPESLNRLQHEWMRTPRKELGGRIPLAIIFEERRARTSHPARDAAYVRDQISEMYGWARAAWEDGETDVALRELETILAIDPSNPFARRLIAQI